MNKSSAVNVKVLRSSSHGNSTLIWNSTHTLLVDCGLGPRVTETLLREQGLLMRDLSGVLITHAHHDHGNILTLQRILRASVPVYCAPGVKNVFERDLPQCNGFPFRIFSKKSFFVGSFNVATFEVDHDSEGGCFGFCLISWKGEDAKKISIVTDYGPPGKKLAIRLVDSHLILMASNYDTEMIKSSRVVPDYVKQRHILPFQPSNEICADILLEALQRSQVLPKVVYLLHISQNHNTADKAVTQLRQALDSAGYRHVRVLPTYRDATSETTRLT
jgi:phosphoribosyl 1,2-cyclic phosphodiesterase